MQITPLILGRGQSGRAMARSLACLKIVRPDFEIVEPVWLSRGVRLLAEAKRYQNPILCISNPHGLHAETILDADRAGFNAIMCEKPACVNVQQLETLRSIKTPTAIMHTYRQMWGVQQLKEMVTKNYFGKIISIEGRYWQASKAIRVLETSTEISTKSWKDDPQLSGPYDAYLDIATHWIDAASFLMGQPPSEMMGWKSYLNSEMPHRDSHLHLSMAYPGTRALVSVSKTFHGVGNHFELNVLGTKMSATWHFANPDEIILGEGRHRRVVTRQLNTLGSQLPPFHGMGWLEGYIEIASRLLDHCYHSKIADYPDLVSHLGILNSMLSVRWI